MTLLQKNLAWEGGFFYHQPHSVQAAIALRDKTTGRKDKP
jgi:hypothetical protein